MMGKNEQATLLCIRQIYETDKEASVIIVTSRAQFDRA